MPPVGRMNRVAVAERCLLVHHAVAVGIAEPPQIGRGGHVERVLVGKHAARDIAGHILVEPLEHDERLVGAAIAVGVTDAVDPFLVSGEVPPVVRSIRVAIRQPRITGAALGRQVAPEELPEVLHRAQGVHLGHPVGMLADVHGHARTRGSDHVDGPIAVDVETNRIGDELGRRPERQFEAFGKLSWNGLPGLPGPLLDVPGREPDGGGRAVLALPNDAGRRQQRQTGRDECCRRYALERAPAGREGTRGDGSLQHGMPATSAWDDGRAWPGRRIPRRPPSASPTAWDAGGC